MNNLITSIKKNMDDKDLIEARRLFKIATEIDSSNIELKKLSSKLNKKKGGEVLRRDPSITQAQVDKMYTQALRLSRTNPAESKRLLQRVVRADPSHIKARVTLSKLEANAPGSNTKRRKTINQRAKTFYAEGIVHYNNGRISEAKNAFDRALRIEPRYAKARKARDKCIKYLRQ